MKKAARGLFSVLGEEIFRQLLFYNFIGAFDFKEAWEKSQTFKKDSYK